jgi:L-fuculose-phosphate aldolase
VLFETERGRVADCGRQMLADRLAVGSSGNISVRLSGEDLIAITPSGIPYQAISAEDVCVLGLDGRPVAATALPSSETPLHLAVYAATPARAVVHTHSPVAAALSTVADELPPIHYAILNLGGAVRVAPYATFGSVQLAENAVAGLAGRHAVLLQNHGAVTCGGDLGQAYDRAALLEWLAVMYTTAVSAGRPRILSPAELEEVASAARALRQRRAGWPGPPDPQRG